MSREDIIKRTKASGNIALHTTLSVPMKFSNHKVDITTSNLSEGCCITRYNIVKQLLTSCPLLAPILDKKGRTPLHWVTASNFMSIVILLLELLTSEQVGKSTEEDNGALYYTDNE